MSFQIVGAHSPNKRLSLAQEHRVISRKCRCWFCELSF